MSSKQYDIELPIVYDDTYKHYVPAYTVSGPYFTHTLSPNSWNFHYYVSFDDGSETELGYSSSNAVPYPYWAISASSERYYSSSGWKDGNKMIPDVGVFSKVYFRNPHRDKVVFSENNCYVRVTYQAPAVFAAQWNSTGFAANVNPSFKCSTVPRNTYKQYEWASATVYYKASTDVNYQSVTGTISGSWSDYTISTNLTLSDGVTYDVYITAVSDAGTTASTPVAQFTATDADAVATCIAPSGAFTNGDVTFVWSHSTEYGTPQYAYDLQYSNNNGGSWTTVASHVVTQLTTTSTTLTDAGVYLWRVRTYNSNDIAGEWAEATFVNNAPANPPTSVGVNTKGRPTVEWASASQSAYQVQFLLGDSVVYDSGAVYTAETKHFVNQYFNDNRSYVVRVRIYNALGEISEWAETGYQQPNVNDVVFDVQQAGTGGATISITPDNAFIKYYILRDNKPIAEITSDLYTDYYAVGLTNYSVVGVTSDDQSDIQSKGFNVAYDHATIIVLNGQTFLVNKRVDNSYEVQTSNEADINKANFIGDDSPTHYPSNMRIKSFTVQCFDDQGIMEDILGKMVFYADNFGNGGWCMVTSYDKTDSFVRNSQGAYANEVSLRLEVTNYDDSIEYSI